MALTALTNLQDAGFKDAKISVVCTRQNIGQLDEFKALADEYGATLRLTRLRPSGRGADVWDELHPLPEQQRVLYDWLMAHGEDVLTGDSFFHLAAFGEAPPGPQPVRRRPGGLPDRPGGRRLRLPVRDPRQLPRGQPARPTAASRRCGRPLSCSRSCARRRPAARVRSASSSTPAGAAAWPRSSSPACRSTVRTPSASRGTASRPSPGTRRSRLRARTTPRPPRPATSR